MSDTLTAQTTVVRTERGLSIAGTRITLYDVMAYIKAGWPPTLLGHWLNLDDRQIADVMSYIEAHRDEVEEEYRLVLHQAAETRAYWDERNKELLDQVAALPDKPGYEAAIAKLRKEKAELGFRKLKDVYPS